MPGPTRRELEREIEREGPDRDERDSDPVKTWRAFIDQTHPSEMDAPEEEQAVRKLWTMDEDGLDDLAELTDAEIDELDRQIRETIEAGGHPYAPPFPSG